MDIHAIGSHAASNPVSRIQENGGPETQSFLNTLKESIEQVNSIQADADAALSDLVTGKNPNLHQTMIALEKADTTFQLMMQVRNKIVSAYEEIVRMQV